MTTELQAAWMSYLLTVKVRYVDACRCSQCEKIRWTFERQYTGKALAGRLARQTAAVVLAT
jgi:hypothetical protein